MDLSNIKDRAAFPGFVRSTSIDLNIDEVDFPPNDYIFRKRDAFFVIGGICTFLADWVFDLLAAINHWKHGNFYYFIFTLIAILAPSLIITTISTWWYIQDTLNKSRPKGGSFFQLWLTRSIFHIFQLAPIIRYLECLNFGWRSREAWKNGNNVLQRQLYTLMLYVDADCVLLRIIEGFMEAIPQLMLQLYILFQYETFLNNPIWDKVLWFNCMTSLVSVAWGVTAYFRDSRYTDVFKNNISIKGSMILLAWQILSIGSRVLAVVIFSSLVELWVFALCFAHWILMFVWFMGRRSFKGIGSTAYEIFLSSIFAAIYIFAFINDKDEPTRRKYVLFYSVFAVENLAMMVAWLVFGDVTKWFYSAGVIGHYVSFTLALLFMALYYGRYHPSQMQGKMGTPQHRIPTLLSSLGNKVRSSSPNILERKPDLQSHVDIENSNGITDSFSLTSLNKSAKLNINPDLIPKEETSMYVGNTSSATSQCTLYDNAESYCINTSSQDTNHSSSRPTDKRTCSEFLDTKIARYCSQEER